MAATRDDVARAAGVSTAVVSYVVNDGPRRVSATTRKRVLEAIDTLGYVPHDAARALRAGRSRSIGLVVPDIGLPYFGQMAQEVATGALELGYQLLIGTSRWSLDTERQQLDALEQRRVDGVVLMSVEPERAARRPPTQVPLIIVDRPRYAREGAASATLHLVGHGYRRIGMLAAEGDHATTRRRVESYHSTLRSAGLESFPPIFSRPSEASGARAAELLTGFEAVLVETDVQAVGLLSALHRSGVDCPGQMAVVSADSTGRGAYTVPALTTLDQPTSDIAREAVAAVLGTNSASPTVLAHEGFELITRRSCGCPADPPP